MNNENTIIINKPKLANGLLKYSKVLLLNDNKDFKIINASIIFNDIVEWEDSLRFMTDNNNNNHPISKFSSPRGDTYFIGTKEDLDNIYKLYTKRDRLGLELSEEE